MQPITEVSRLDHFTARPYFSHEAVLLLLISEVSALKQYLVVNVVLPLFISCIVKHRSGCGLQSPEMLELLDSQRLHYLQHLFDFLVN